MQSVVVSQSNWNTLKFGSLGTICIIRFKAIFQKSLDWKQGGHKPVKDGKHGKLREFEKLLESHGKLSEIWIFVEKPGKLREKNKYETQS